MRAVLLFLISVFLFCIYIKTNAQVPGTKADPKTSSLENNTNNDQNATQIQDKQNKKQKAAKAQIYIGNDWPPGTIKLREGGVINENYIRYNFLTDQMQFVSGKDTLVLANPQELNTITFDGHTFIYETYQYDTILRQGYFELIVPGKNKLLLRRFVTNQKQDSKNPDDESLTKYQVDECYFISKPGMPANKLACNRKSALTFLNDHDEDIAEYLRITGNKVRTIEDLINLVSYYNSLDEEY
jgi:hypothetical protein